MTGARRLALTLLLCLVPLAAPAPDDGLPVPVDGPEEARRLCAALELPERVGRDEPEERERIEERQARRREEARGRQYLAEVEGAGLRLHWDREDRLLWLSGESSLRAAGGALKLWVVDEARLPAQVGEAQVRRITDAQREGALRVRLRFGISDDDEISYCSRPTGTGQRTLGVVPVGWWYLAGDEELARGGEAAPLRAAPARAVRGKAPPADPRGAEARVSVGDPLGVADGGAVRRVLEASLPALRGCYRKARAARSGLEGTLAVELELDAGGGAPRGARVALDSVMDPGLARCALQAVSAVRFPAGTARRVQVPLRFGSP